jgi:hypothetical protein
VNRRGAIRRMSAWLGVAVAFPPAAVLAEDEVIPKESWVRVDFDGRDEYWAHLRSGAPATWVIVDTYTRRVRRIPLVNPHSPWERRIRARIFEAQRPVPLNP